MARVLKLLVAALRFAMGLLASALPARINAQAGVERCRAGGILNGLDGDRIPDTGRTPRLVDVLPLCPTVAEHGAAARHVD